jgi:hypothetical protein
MLNNDGKVKVNETRAPRHGRSCFYSVRLPACSGTDALLPGELAATHSAKQLLHSRRLRPRQRSAIKHRNQRGHARKDFRELQACERLQS